MDWNQSNKNENPSVTSGDLLVLHGDVLCRILSYLSWREVISCRQVLVSWREAVSNTLVPDFYVDGPFLAEHLTEIAQCIPKLQSLQMDQASQIRDQLFRPDCFTHLKHLVCRDTVLQSSFGEILKLRHLQTLNLHGSEQIEWKLSDLAEFVHLKDLRCINNRCVTGDTSDLLVQSKIWQVIDVSGCVQVTGNLMDFAKFPSLKWLGLSRTNVQGDMVVVVTYAG